MRYLLLLRYWPELVAGTPAAGQRVLLPLCGKSKDLGWFYRQGYSVVGVEGVRQPVNELFQDENLEYDVRRVEEIDGWVVNPCSQVGYFSAIIYAQKLIISTYDRFY